MGKIQVQDSGRYSSPAEFDVIVSTLTGFSLSPNPADAGGIVTMNVTLSGPAPSNGFPLTLKGLTGYGKELNSMSITAGHTTGQFQIQLFDMANDATITLGLSPTTVDAYHAGGPLNQSLQILGIRAASVTFLPTAITQGKTVTGTVTMTLPVPVTTTVTLASSNPYVVVPVSVTLSAGQSEVSFTVSTASVVTGSGTATISAAVSGQTPVATGSLPYSKT
jgi:hypothetical protein